VQVTEYAELEVLISQLIRNDIRGQNSVTLNAVVRKPGQGPQVQSGAEFVGCET
jgi:hypothetical protein